MLPYQRRAVAERDALRSKIKRLAGFFGTPTYARLPQEERSRLERQARAMIAYEAALSDRIAAFCLDSGITHEGGVS